MFKELNYLSLGQILLQSIPLSCLSTVTSYTGVGCSKKKKLCNNKFEFTENENYKNNLGRSNLLQC